MTIITPALQELAELFGDPVLAQDVGEQFTCSEADTIARILATSGHSGAAARWLFGHSLGDETDDRHLGMTEASAEAYVSDMSDA